jgi:N-dimethylarginine dimethylaminohydrolase
VGKSDVTTEWAPLRQAIVESRELATALARANVEILQARRKHPRDALFVVGRHVIAGSLRATARRREIDALTALIAPTHTVPPGADNEVDGPFLEGGDVVLNGSEIYVGMSGNASNLEGIDWLAALVGAGVRVVPMAMRSSVRHLEDVLALVRPGLLIQCRTLLVDGLPRALRDWQSIDIAPEESANVLVLDERRVLLDRTQSRLAAELHRHGIETVTVGLGGGLRSAHCALLRE